MALMRGGICLERGDGSTPARQRKREWREQNALGLAACGLLALMHRADSLRSGLVPYPDWMRWRGVGIRALLNSMV